MERRNPSLLQFEHVPRLLDVADRVVRGELMNVLVIMPPRYFKTETFSRLLPAHYLTQHPKRHVGLSCHSADLAWEFSEEARGYFTDDGGAVRRETSAKKRWRVDAGGEMWAVGAGASMIGRGFHLGIVDDPTDPEKAHSPAYQKRFERWWPGKFLSRRQPGAAVIFVMQRLGPLDPVDFLFRREVGENTDYAPMHWHVVVCDEVKSDAPLGRWDGPQGLPATCTLEPDDRKRGHVLAPSLFDESEVARMQRDAGAFVAQAQRQQRPSAPQGDYWLAEWFGWDDGKLADDSFVYDELPATAFNGGKDWDTAFTADEANSATAYVESYRGPGKPDEFPIYIHDAGWEWYEFPKLLTWIKELRGPHHVEDKASGKSAIQTLRTHGVSVAAVKVDGDKFTRANSVQPVVSNRRVKIHRKLLRRLLEGERQGLLGVTAERLLAGGPDLDLNDAFVQALRRHTRRAGTGGSAPPPSTTSDYVG